MVSVRPPATSDRSKWEDLWHQYNAFYGREGDTALSQSIIDAHGSGLSILGNERQQSPADPSSGPTMRHISPIETVRCPQ